ncbi:hypothetical protein CsSME_00042688 [Camellia sinensis var. sinensis]
MFQEMESNGTMAHQTNNASTAQGQGCAGRQARVLPSSLSLSSLFVSFHKQHTITSFALLLHRCLTTFQSPLVLIHLKIYIFMPLYSIEVLYLATHNFALEKINFFCA